MPENNLIKQWPHAPLHKFDSSGKYMITVGTYNREHYFNTPSKLTLLHNTLLDVSLEYGWKLQAWAVFSNHYHFIGISPQNSNSTNLNLFLNKLHGITAIQINKIDNCEGRKVWHQFWDTKLTYEKSYLARLHYVQQNPVKHNLVSNAFEYPWSSANWFKNNASDAFYKTVTSFKTDSVKILDDF